MKKLGQHVVPRGGRWAVLKAGASKATVIVDTQAEAVTKARDMARKQGTELYIHGRDGRIRERSSFGSDPFPPRG